MDNKDIYDTVKSIMDNEPQSTWPYDVYPEIAARIIADRDVQSNPNYQTAIKVPL